jgi:hypothetical protein
MLISDNAFISTQNSGRYVNINNLTITPRNGYLSNFWADAYSLITNANLAIVKASKINFPSGKQQQANQLLGELYAARALAYFDLVRMFAQPYTFKKDASQLGVPLITKPSSEVTSPSRATVKQVYHQIILDLQEGESLMQSNKKDGHFTSIVAEALLAKVYLYMNNWEEAEKYATKVIQGGPYSLISTQNYVSSWGKNFPGGSIFEIANNSTDNPDVAGIGFFTQKDGYGDALATANLYNIYTGTDVRRQLIQVGVRSGAEDPAYYIEKYPHGATSKDDNIEVIRLAGVYLIRAEARAELSKTDPSKTGGAQKDLDKIVQRADPQASDITLTGEPLVKRILLERRKELAFEGDRFWDLTRNKMDVKLITSTQTKIFEYPNWRFAMPIPQNEMTSNPNMVQNPEYTQ